MQYKKSCEQHHENFFDRTQHSKTALLYHLSAREDSFKSIYMQLPCHACLCFSCYNVTSHLTIGGVYEKHYIVIFIILLDYISIK